MGPLSIEQALAEEAAAIHDVSKPEIKAIVDELNRLATTQGIEGERANKDADQRSGKDENWRLIENRKRFYCELGKLDRAALCCSGGGIRSATFCLGIIQALASYRLEPKLAATDNEVGLPDQRSRTSAEAVETDANESLLSRFHYLSTVSGGGYIGSWLSAWRSRNDFPTVWQSLSSRPEGPDVEPPEISWLRAYSNFLTPRVGLLSADTWTGIAIYLRNLLLNWLVIIPAIAVVVLILKFFISASVHTARLDDAWWPHLVTLLLGATCLIVAQRFTTRHRPTSRALPGTDPTEDVSNNADQNAFLFGNLIWSLLSALFVTSSLTSAVGTQLAGAASTGGAIAVGAVIGVFIYAGGWLAGWPLNWRFHDWIRWAASGAVYGGFVGLGAHLYTLMTPYSVPHNNSVSVILVPVILGVPWALLSKLFADLVFVGLVSYEKKSDSDREWLGRASGWLAATAVAWIITTAVTFAGGHYLIEVDIGQALAPYLASAGGISGILTAWLGNSGMTGKKAASDQKDTKSLISEIGIALAGPVFAAVLVVGISVGLDLMLFGRSLLVGLTNFQWTYGEIYLLLTIGFIVSYAVAFVASRNVNINRFSIHALYRNRLMRAYLGASRQERRPDRFTGFDIADNLKAHELWPPEPYKRSGGNSYSLFHVVNITLNLVKSTRLAWQQRKAESFTVSPLHSGAAYKGYRPSDKYGGDIPPCGISLGTAMAVSGAAASPNMGYHSSPSTAILLALFNVRLGWWLGNPGKEGEGTYTKEGPRTAIRPLAEETFGLTTDTKPWVYLSDGGHFENLGIYEMVRRRCRFIVAIDAGCDPKFKYEDLGNALRKIYIDLGVRIQFPLLDQLRNRPDSQTLQTALTEWKKNKDEQKKAEGKEEDQKEAKRTNCPKSPIPYYAIGTIDYEKADGEGCRNGTILYIKPAYHGVSEIEGAGVRSYAESSKDFPHEPTADQWFSESQFESYRSLALDIASTILGPDCVLDGGPGDITVNDILRGLSPTARPGGSEVR